MLLLLFLGGLWVGCSFVDVLLLFVVCFVLLGFLSVLLLLLFCFCFFLVCLLLFFVVVVVVGGMGELETPCQSAVSSCFSLVYSRVRVFSHPSLTPTPAYPTQISVVNTGVFASR